MLPKAIKVEYKTNGGLQTVSLRNGRQILFMWGLSIKEPIHLFFDVRIFSTTKHQFTNIVLATTENQPSSLGRSSALQVTNEEEYSKWKMVDHSFSMIIIIVIIIKIISSFTVSVRTLAASHRRFHNLIKTFLELLWTTDQPVAKASTYTGQHNTERQTSMP
jgi:hypothetical protein